MMLFDDLIYDFTLINYKLINYRELFDNFVEYTTISSSYFSDSEDRVEDVFNRMIASFVIFSKIKVENI